MADAIKKKQESTDEKAVEKLAEQERTAEERSKLSVRIQELQTIRDDLRVRMHLAGKEANDMYRSMEKKWAELGQKSDELKRASKDSAHRIREASMNVLDEIQEGYKRLRRRL